MANRAVDWLSAFPEHGGRADDAGRSEANEGRRE